MCSASSAPPRRPLAGYVHAVRPRCLCGLRRSRSRNLVHVAKSVCAHGEPALLKAVACSWQSAPHLARLVAWPFRRSSTMSSPLYNQLPGLRRSGTGTSTQFSGKRRPRTSPSAASLGAHAAAASPHNPVLRRRGPSSSLAQVLCMAGVGGSNSRSYTA